VFEERENKIQRSEMDILDDDDDNNNNNLEINVRWTPFFTRKMNVIFIQKQHSVPFKMQP
jgi:hypothetical protein